MIGVVTALFTCVHFLQLSPTLRVSLQSTPNSALCFDENEVLIQDKPHNLLRGVLSLGVAIAIFRFYLKKYRSIGRTMDVMGCMDLLIKFEILFPILEPSRETVITPTSISSLFQAHKRDYYCLWEYVKQVSAVFAVLKFWS